MRNDRTRILVAASFFLLGAIASEGTPAQHSASEWSPAIPRTWDDEAVESLEIPLASPAASPRHISSDYYYRMPVRPIYKSYPVYRPDKEPWILELAPKAGTGDRIRCIEVENERRLDQSRRESL